MGEEVNMDPEVITDGEKILADKILSLLTDDDKLSHYAQKAEERSLVYTPDRYKDSIHEIFKRYE